MAMKKLIPIVIALLCFQATGLQGQVKLPKLISDSLILQRDTEVKIWGWAAANEAVELVFGESRYQTRANKEGNWLIILPAQKAGGPYELTFQSSDTISVKNVMFGDVWLCSGQSNMELMMERVKEKYDAEIAHSENENIRQFLVPDKYDFKKEHSDYDEGRWISANPENVLGFSALAYFFARDLYEKYQVPIGIINAALGGSPVEAWMSEDALKEFPESYNELQKFKNDRLIAGIEASDKHRSGAWYKNLNQKDKGFAQIPYWKDAGFEDKDWESMEIPGYWADHAPGSINGSVWFRKKINIPPSMAGKPAKLWLGRLIDQDYTYLNGELVGTTGYQYPPRRYTVEEGILKEGENTLAIRMISNIGKGGFVLDKPYYLAVDNDTIDLKGAWKYKVGAIMDPLEEQTFIRWKPAGLYKRMIAPLMNTSIKGVIWYQGESNTKKAIQYGETFPAMINDWRQNWDQGNFPFIYVQLANYMKESDHPSESDWARLRQAQLSTLELPNTGMAVAIDLGEWNDIHPSNKEDVAKRLALQAQVLAYHEKDIQASGPLPVAAKFRRRKVRVTFDNVGNGLTSKDGDALRYFSISSDGKNFVWAEAKIKDDIVTVWNDQVKKPIVVRYAWADNPSTANLYAVDGLPACPFEIVKE